YSNYLHKTAAPQTMIPTRAAMLISRSPPGKPILGSFFPGPFLAMAAQPRTDCAVIPNLNRRFVAGQTLKLVEIFLIARPVPSKLLDELHAFLAFQKSISILFFPQILHGIVCQICIVIAQDCFQRLFRSFARC